MASAERLAMRSESSWFCSSWWNVSTNTEKVKTSRASTYVVVSDVFWQVHVDHCEAVSDRIGNVGLDRISLGTVSVCCCAGYTVLRFLTSQVL